MKHKIIITLDIDWAPDFAISKVLDQLDYSGVKGTFFPEAFSIPTLPASTIISATEVPVSLSLIHI